MTKKQACGVGPDAVVCLMTRLDIVSPFGGSPVFFLPETESTINDAKALASRDFPSGTVVVAGHQTAGRGRFEDRSWKAEPGESLLFTLFLGVEELDGPVGLVPLKLGLGLAVTLERLLDLHPAIKWPNDVYLGCRKVAGLLAESRDGLVFLSMGVNCLQKEFPPDLSRKAVSLRMQTGKDVAPLDLLPPLLDEVNFRLSGGSGDWKRAIEERLYLKGAPVEFRLGLVEEEVPFSGRIVGILDDGQIVIEGEGEVRAFAAGEIVTERRG